MTLLELCKEFKNETLEKKDFYIIGNNKGIISYSELFDIIQTQSLIDKKFFIKGIYNKLTSYEL